MQKTVIFFLVLSSLALCFSQIVTQVVVQVPLPPAYASELGVAVYREHIGDKNDAVSGAFKPYDALNRLKREGFVACGNISLLNKNLALLNATLSRDFVSYTLSTDGVPRSVKNRAAYLAYMGGIAFNESGGQSHHHLDSFSVRMSSDGRAALVTAELQEAGYYGGIDESSWSTYQAAMVYECPNAHGPCMDGEGSWLAYSLYEQGDVLWFPFATAAWRRDFCPVQGSAAPVVTTPPPTTPFHHFEGKR